MSSKSQKGMGRRDFLKFTSACALATATLGPKLFAAGAESAPRGLAVGYAALDEGAALSSASSIAASDGGFIGRGARVAASGAVGLASEPRARRAVELLTHYEYFDGAERKTAPFLAWGGSRSRGCQGSPISFTVPVNERQAIDFIVGAEAGVPVGEALTLRDAVTGETTHSIALPVSLGLQNDAPLKLARGFYVIVPMFEGDSEPRWSSWSLRPLEGRYSLVDQSGSVAPFEHFVLRIDYAAS